MTRDYALCLLVRMKTQEAVTQPAYSHVGDGLIEIPDPLFLRKLRPASSNFQAVDKASKFMFTYPLPWNQAKEFPAYF